MFRAVFDTNVLLSAFVFGGNPEKCFELARHGEIKLLTCPSILVEFAGHLSDKFLWAAADSADAIRSVGYSSELVKPKSRLSVVADDADNRVLECAVEGKADFIVSGDRHLVVLGTYQNVTILRPADFLNEIGL